MSGPRHCMVVHAYYPQAETRVEREAFSLIQHGYEVDVMCLRDRNEKHSERVRGVNVYRLPVRRRRGRGPVMQMLEYLAFFFQVLFHLAWKNLWHRYDSVQVHNLPDFLVFSAVGAKMLGARIILDLHDLMPEFFASSYRSGMNGLPVQLLLLQEKTACRFADHIITVTDLWRQYLVQRGLNPAKVSVVMNVADQSIFRRVAIPITGQGKQPDHGFHLIYHGTLAPRYGIDLLIEAVARLRKQIPGLHLTIHGNGDYLGELQRRVDDLTARDLVSFSTTYLPVGELPGLLLSANLGVVPYRRDIFTDGILPTKLMEYVALGIPVLAAETPIIRHYFDDSMVEFFRAGDVEDLASAILRLHRSPDRLHQLVTGADLFNQQYDWSRIAAGYVETLDQLINPSNRNQSKSNQII